MLRICFLATLVLEGPNIGNSYLECHTSGNFHPEDVKSWHYLLKGTVFTQIHPGNGAILKKFHHPLSPISLGVQNSVTGKQSAR